MSDLAPILVVDDQPGNLLALEAVFSSSQCRLVRAVTAADALRALSSTDFAAMILDIHMPDMSGLELARLAKERRRTRDVPILFLTARMVDRQDVLAGYALGAVDYLTKPIEPVVLQAKIAVFVQLFRQRLELAEASRLKSAFLANMSHELRTPLNAIIGFSELLHDGKVGPVTAQQKEFLGDVLASSRHLLHLIGDVLDLAKVESGTMEFHPRPVDVDAVVREVRDTLRADAGDKGVAVEVDVDDTLPPVVSDERKLKQLLYNYVSNALKFTPEGGRVAIRVRPEPGERFRVEVEDTGIGIREQDLGRLFREFQQLDNGPARRYAGTGLGLALCKRIAEAQGGSVGARSALGQGSVFYAVLPCRLREAAGRS
jgi:signal transduction histidine kinase